MWPQIVPLGLKENKERERGRKWKDWREVEDVQLIFCTTDLSNSRYLTDLCTSLQSLPFFSFLWFIKIY